MLLRVLTVLLFASCALTEPDTVGVGVGHTFQQSGEFMDPSWTYDQGDATSVHAWAAWNFGDRTRHEETIASRNAAATIVAGAQHRERTEVDALRDRVVEFEKRFEIEALRSADARRAAETPTPVPTCPTTAAAADPNDPQIPLSWLILGGSTLLAGGGAAGRYLGRRGADE